MQRPVCRRTAHLLALTISDTAQEWGDKPLPEDGVIDAAHPTRSGRHDLYVEAMRLVGAKQSKGALVALVNWLLQPKGQSVSEGSVASRVDKDLVDELNDAICGLLHDGNKTGYHAPRMHLEAFYALPARTTCMCRTILTTDKTRHFRECPLREKYNDPPKERT